MGGRRQRLARALLVQALRRVEPREHVVAYGLPDQEGNVVEVLRWLAEHDTRRLVWLTSAGDRDAVAWALRGTPYEGRLVVLPKRSLRGLAWYVTARGVFHSHHLYLSPPALNGRVVVNTWHGDGPKQAANAEAPARDGPLLVAGTTVWGERKARAHGAGADRLLVVGNPRIDQLGRPASDEALRRLGIDPRRPFVLWAPTFREAASPDGRRHRDADVLTAGPAARQLRGVADACAPDLQLVVRPHALDVDDYAALGLPLVDERALARAEVGLYQLLGRAAALLTDYSSIWVDFLPVDRPVGHYCPDLAAYAAARGLDVQEFRQHLAGPLLTSADALTAFLRAVGRGEDPGGERRAEVARALGAVVELGATDRLMARVWPPPRG